MSKTKAPDCIQMRESGEWYIRQKAVVKSLKLLSKRLCEVARIQANQQLQELLDDGKDIDVRAAQTLRDDTVHNVKGAMKVVIDYFSDDLNGRDDVKENS